MVAEERLDRFDVNRELRGGVPTTYLRRVLRGMEGGIAVLSLAQQFSARRLPT